MSVKRVEPNQAAELIGEGWAYLDVRSVGEFDQGHPKGAYNVPLVHMEPGGARSVNEDFMAVCEAAFSKDTKLVVGCRTGVRSLRAAGMLLDAGYADVVDMRGGFVGETDAAGGVTCPGWTEWKLPVQSKAEPGRSYAELEAKK
jgi:rhodanese-related sulfurtransferase